jgi:glucosylceramidase
MKSPLAAFDFSAAGPWYSYDDFPGDLGLRKFSIRRDMDTNGLLSFILRARQYGKFYLQSTMDYPPDWMLDARQDVKPEYYPVLAQYQVRYLEKYYRQGITIDYLSPFNEPQYIYCKIGYEEIATYIKEHLGPALRGAGLLTKLQTSDSHNREVGLKHFPAMLSDPGVKRYISTISLHGYQWDKQGSGAMSKLHEMFPDMSIWQSEVCYAKTIDKQTMPVYGFEDGDRWGRMILGDVNNWASGWIYWNAILDQNGGPWLVSVEHGNPEDNPQHPVVIVNTETGAVEYPGLYWYLAHFSRYVRPGFHRVASTGPVADLTYAAFTGPRGERVLEVINSGTQARRFNIREGWQAAEVEQPARSIATYLWSGR